MFLLLSEAVLHMYPDYWMSPHFQVPWGPVCGPPQTAKPRARMRRDLSRGCLEQVDIGYKKGKEMEQNRKAPAALRPSGRLGPSPAQVQAAGAADRGQEVWGKPTKDHFNVSLRGLEGRGVPGRTSETGPAPSPLIEATGLASLPAPPHQALEDKGKMEGHRHLVLPAFDQPMVLFSFQGTPLKEKRPSLQGWGDQRIAPSRTHLSASRAKRTLLSRSNPTLRGLP